MIFNEFLSAMENILCHLFLESAVEFDFYLKITQLIINFIPWKGMLTLPFFS